MFLVSLQRNVIYLTAEKAVHTLGGLASMVLVARSLGAEALADYGFAVSLTAFFVPALDLGMNNRMIKSVAGGDDVSGAVNDVLRYKLSVAPMVFLLMTCVGWWWGGADVTALVMLMGISTVGMSLGDGANSVFKGLHRSNLSCMLVGFLNVVLLGSLVVVLRSGSGLVAVGWCYALSRLLYSVTAFLLLKRVRADVRLTPRLGLVRTTIWSGLLHLPGVYYLGNLLYLSYLATYVMSPLDAGVYYIGYRAAAAVYILVSAGFEAVLATAVSREGRPSGLGMWFVIYSVIALLVLFLLAPLAVIIFGPGFEGSVRPIRLLASCIPPFVLCGLGHTLLMAAKKERFAAATMAVLLVCGFAMAVLAERFIGAESTALMPAISSLVAMGVLWVALSRRVKTLA